MIPAQMQIPGLDLSANLHNSATEVLCLMNMLDIEELMDDEEYEGNKNVKRGRSLIKVLLIERQILIVTIRGQRIILSSRHKHGKKVLSTHEESNLRASDSVLRCCAAAPLSRNGVLGQVVNFLTW